MCHVTKTLKRCVVSGWHIIPLDARVMRKLEIFMINIENILNSFDVSELIKLVEIHAKKHHDGHYTIFSFTSEYKVAFDTPNIDSSEATCQVNEVKGYATLKEALIHAILCEKTFNDYWSGGNYHKYMTFCKENR